MTVLRQVRVCFLPAYLIGLARLFVSASVAAETVDQVLLAQVRWLEEQAVQVKSIQVELTHTPRLADAGGDRRPGAFPFESELAALNAEERKIRIEQMRIAMELQTAELQRQVIWVVSREQDESLERRIEELKTFEALEAAEAARARERVVRNRVRQHCQPALSDHYRADWRRQRNKVIYQWTTTGNEPEETIRWALDDRVKMTRVIQGRVRPRIDFDMADASVFFGRAQPYEFAFEQSGFPLGQLIRLAPWREVARGEDRGQPRLDVLVPHPRDSGCRVLLSFDRQHRLVRRDLFVRQADRFCLVERDEFLDHQAHSVQGPTPLWFPRRVILRGFAAADQRGDPREIATSEIQINRIVFNEELADDQFAIHVPQEAGIFDGIQQKWIHFPKRAQLPDNPSELSAPSGQQP